MVVLIFNFDVPDIKCFMYSYSFTTLHHLTVKVIVLTTSTFTKCIILTRKKTDIQKNEATCPRSHSKLLCLPKSVLRCYESSTVRKQNPITQQLEKALCYSKSLC